MKKLIKFSIYGVFAIVAVVFLQSTVFSNNEKTTPTKKPEHQKPASKPEPNYRLLRRKAIDSLIENKIATPENFDKIRKMYPDSLCHC